MGDYISASASAFPNAVIATPVKSMQYHHDNGMLVGSNDINNMIDDNVYNGSLYDDTIERSGELFTQLDHMIAAVQIESNAVDSMREKLKELDTLRNQLSNSNKRLLDADQTNLTLKGNLMKVQEAYADLKRSKIELETTYNPIKQELNRAKDMYNKEKMARLSAQQETAQMKEHIMRLEKANEELGRECKSIPAISESNEILKTDLSQLRQRYKEDRIIMQNQIRTLEHKSREVDTVKNNVRNYALRLLDISSGNADNINSSSVNNSSSMKIQHQQLQQHNPNIGLRIQADPYSHYDEGPSSINSQLSKHAQSQYYDNSTMYNNSNIINAAVDADTNYIDVTYDDNSTYNSDIDDQHQQFFDHNQRRNTNSKQQQQQQQLQPMHFQQQQRARNIPLQQQQQQQFIDDDNDAYRSPSKLKLPTLH